MGSSGSEVGRNQQLIRNNDFNNSNNPTKHFVTAPELLQGAPVTLPSYPSAAPQWNMHPSSEQMLPQVGSLPVSSFSSSRGSPDSSDYGSGPASNADLSTVEMLSGRESQVSDKEQQSLLKDRLKYQIEYYFSPVNLAKDKFLRSQMDAEQFVPVALIAGFNMVKRLTLDLPFITEAIRASPKLELDDFGARVRPRSNRSTVVIHDLPETVTKEDLVGLFAKQTVVKPVNFECADKSCWYVEFEEEDDAKEALRYLMAEVTEFNGAPIQARIRALPATAGGGSFKGMDGSHSIPGMGNMGGVSPMSDESVQQQLSHVSGGDPNMQGGHPFPAYPAFQTSNNQYFPQQFIGPHSQINPLLLYQMQQYQMHTGQYMDMSLLMFNNMAQAGQLAQQHQQQPLQPPPQQQQQPQPQHMAPSSYRGAPASTRGRGAGGSRRGTANPVNNYAGRSENRRGNGRIESYPNSGRNSAMSESGRSEQNHVPSQAQGQHSRHGSFSSVNGGRVGGGAPQDVATHVVDARSGSHTPPVYPDGRGRTSSIPSEGTERRSSAVERKPKRPPIDLPNAADSTVVAEQPEVTREPQEKFDLATTMFPPLPAQTDGTRPSGGSSHSSSHPTSANVSAADVVRGVANVRISGHSNAWSGETSDFAHSDEHGRISAHHNDHHPTSGNHHIDSLRKKEQGSSTDDLPKSGRDQHHHAVGEGTKVRAAAESVAERPRMNLSAGTQTTSTGIVAGNFTNSTTSTGTGTGPTSPQHSNAGTSSRDDGKQQSSPKKLSVPAAQKPQQQTEKPAAASPVGADRHVLSPSSGSRRSSFGESKSVGEAEAISEASSLKGTTGDTSPGKGGMSWSRVAQINRDKLPVASGSGSVASGGSAKAPLTKQSSLDSSSQSQEDKRSVVDKDHSVASSSGGGGGGGGGGRSKGHAGSGSGSGRPRFPRQSHNNNNLMANGHDDSHYQQGGGYTNGGTSSAQHSNNASGTTSPTTGMPEDADNEGFIEVVKHHKQPHHQQQHQRSGYRSNGVGRHGGGLQE
ncbi:putative La-related protein [Hypsibius exemplaris]|uniref:La-related protein n=1 Tax=Hypsibius exemplaris TaxID=2072580 RepID=A0A1W0X4P0_HYPEX|nr:putative La-related protein [Hypsibius exemplaris]